MAQVLTTGATIKCTHSGTVKLSSNSKLKVSDTPVLLKDGLSSIDGCTQVTDTNKGTVQDLNATATGTLSQKLMSDGNPVLITPLVAIGDGSPPAPSTLTASEPQSKLVAS